jgi:hypothetical protein
MKYTRPDIYLCECCGQFFDMITDKPVHVSYEEMPAEVAIKVMLLRQGVEASMRQRDHRPKRIKTRKRYRFEP